MSAAGFIELLALLELMSRGANGGGGGQGPPGPPGPPAPYVPPPDVPPPPIAPGPPFPLPPPPAPPGPAPFKIPPPGDIGPPPPAPRPPIPTAPPVSPGVLPPMPPWPPAPVPSGLPPFPGPAWEPDTPVTTAIAQRAAYWNPQLWNYPTKTIRKPYVQEQFGGQWVTFAAAWHPGSAGAHTYMATEAWRLKATQPQPAPAPLPAPTPGAGDTPVQAAARAMAHALFDHGYKKSDQPLYIAFQQQAGLKADGYPGKGTMGVLATVLASRGLPPLNVKVYPWYSRPGTSGYDGVNAPTWAEWNR